MKLICVKNGMWVGSRMLDDSQHWMIDKQKSTFQRQTGDIKLSLQQEPHTHTHTLSHRNTDVHTHTHTHTHTRDWQQKAAWGFAVKWP